MYFETMINMFQKIPFELPKPLSNKERRQSLLHAVGGDWWLKKINEKIPPLKKRRLGRKLQEKEGEIRINVQMENKNRNG